MKIINKIICYFRDHIRTDSECGNLLTPCARCGTYMLNKTSYAEFQKQIDQIFHRILKE